jgi:hypothetical protein
MTFPIPSTKLTPLTIQSMPAPIPAAAESIQPTAGSFDGVFRTQKQLKDQIAEKTFLIQVNKTSLEQFSLELKKNASLLLSEDITDEHASTLLLRNGELKKKQEAVKERLGSDEKFLNECSDLLKKLNHEQSKVLLVLIQKEKQGLEKINQEITQVQASIASIQARLNACMDSGNVEELLKLRGEIRSYNEILNKLEPIKAECSARLLVYHKLKRQFEPIEKLQRIMDFDTQFPNGVHVDKIIEFKEVDGEDKVHWNLKVVPPIAGNCRYIIWAPTMELDAMGWKLPVYISVIPDSESTQDADDLLFDVSELYSQHKDFKIVGWDPSP